MADVSEYIDVCIENKRYGTLFMCLADVLTDEELFSEGQGELFHVIVRLEGLGVDAEEIRKLLRVLFVFTKDRAVYDMSYVNRVYAYAYGVII